MPEKVDKKLPPEMVVERTVPWREEEKGVVILAPRFGSGWIDRWLIRLFGERTVRIGLDDLGSYIWKRLDGATPLQEIIAAFEADFEGRAEKAEARIHMFLKELHRQGWVSFLMPRGDMPKGDR
jgi:hypothetical protein